MNIVKLILSCVLLFVAYDCLAAPKFQLEAPAEVGKAVYYVTASWCGPCKKNREDLRKAGLVLLPLGDPDPADIRLIDLEANKTWLRDRQIVIETVPTILYLSDGKVTNRASGATSILAKDVAAFLRPEVVAPAIPAPAQIADQLVHFAGPIGTITLKPAKPLVIQIDPKTIVTYSETHASYVVAPNGEVTLTFASPLPHIDYRNFIHLGMDAQYVKFNEPNGVVGTSKGKYKFKWEPK